MQRYQFLENEKGAPLIINYGELGTCQLLSDRKTKELYALKLAPKLDVINDIKCLTRMNHPNIIKVIDHLDHEDNKLIIFQFLKNGDLLTKIQCGELKKSSIPSVFKGICSAVQYIHSNGIIHRNLKSQTILLDQNFVPRLVDFGLAARLTTRNTFCGCCYYMAPQILKSCPYSSKVDIWALGIIFYEMLHGNLPFNGEQPQQLLQAIDQFIEKQGKIVRANSANHLLMQMLTKDPLKRAKIEDILAHPYLNQKKYSLLNSLNPKKSPSALKTSINNLRKKNNFSLKKDNKQTNINCCFVTKHNAKIGYLIDQKQEESQNNKQQSSFGDVIKNKLNALFDGQNLRGDSRFSFTVFSS